jgi:hypothetical protein
MSTPQIKALRALHEGAHIRTIRKPTRLALGRMGLVSSQGLTDSGERWIKHYLNVTGDGPEDLKAMFRV